MKPKRSNSKRVPNRARSAGSHERLVMRRRNLITKIIQSEVGYFNGWAVTAEAEWGACAKAAEKIMRVMSYWKPHNDKLRQRRERPDRMSTPTTTEQSDPAVASSALLGVTPALEWALELFAPLRKTEPVAWQRCDKINATVIEKIQREAFDAGVKSVTPNDQAQRPPT